MTALQHIYVTAHGSFDSGPWVGESAQFGLRLSIAEASAQPAKGERFAMPLNGDVQIDQGVEAGTNGTLTRTWTARRGPVGTPENCDAGFQIDCAEDVRTFLNSCRTLVGPQFSWKAVKLAPIGLVSVTKNGVTTIEGRNLAASSVYTFTTPMTGTGTYLMPPQCAMAISMRANIIGRRGRGRIYLPALAQTSVSTDGTLSTTHTSTARTAFKTLIEALQQLPGSPDYTPLVVITSAGQTDAIRPVEVRTGNRFDTIRSRREQVPESYTPLAL